MINSWNAKLTVIGAVEQEDDKAKAENFLARLVDLARLPASTAAHIADGDFDRYASSTPKADLNIFPLPKKLDAEFLWHLREATGSTCLFTQDSGDITTGNRLTKLKSRFRLVTRRVEFRHQLQAKPQCFPY